LSASGGKPSLPGRPAALATGVGADQAGIHRKALSANQTFRHAARHPRLEQLAEQIAVAEPAMAVLREGRVIGHVAVQPQPAEPAIRQVQVDLVAQPALGADAHAITDDQHPDHQLGGDRGPSRLAIEGLQVLADAGQIDEPVDRTQQMVRRHVPLQAEAVEQRLLCYRPLSHHRPVSRTCGNIESAPGDYFNPAFFNTIGT
jgi:hypothetical protein